MIIELLAVGTKAPAWVQAGYTEYARRMRAGCSLELTEIGAEKRSKSSHPAGLIEKEATRLLAAIPSRAYVVALEVNGQAWSTVELARQMEKWQQNHSHICLLVGGPDGLAGKCLDRADQIWSLSNMTFPHMLVRILVAEQLYRAWSYSRGHPYHRE